MAGRSAGRRLLRGIVVLAGLVAGGALAAARRRRARQAPSSQAVASGGPAGALPAPADPPATHEPEPAPKAGRSREELYREAREIGLKGRSRMTKAQLEAALREHGR